MVKLAKFLHTSSVGSPRVVPWKPIRQFTSLKQFTPKCLCGVKPEITLITSIIYYKSNLSSTTSELYTYKKPPFKSNFKGKRVFISFIVIPSEISQYNVWENIFFFARNHWIKLSSLHVQQLYKK